MAREALGPTVVALEHPCLACAGASPGGADAVDGTGAWARPGGQERLLRRRRGTGQVEATPAENRVKSGIVPVRIPLGIDGEKDQMHVTRGVGLIQPVERGAPLAEAGVHQRR